MMAPGVLLVGHQTSHEILTAARDLARSGWEVHVATGGRRSIAGESRYVRSAHRVCPPGVDLEVFTEHVAKVLNQCGAHVVVGCGDPEVLALSAVRDQLPATVPLADHSTVLEAVDKLSLSEAAIRVGMAVPHTVPANDHAVADWRGPAIVKPRLHFDPRPSGTRSWTSVRLVHNKEELQQAVVAARNASCELVLQQPIDGGLIAISAVRTAEGDLVALMQQRAIRIWPPRVGTSARAVTVPVDPTLGRQVRDLLNDLGWVGMVQVQFLQPDDGPPQLLDLNGRPYGSLPLAQAAGLPLVSLWLGLGDDVEHHLLAKRPAVARPGVVFSRGVPDLKRALTERRGGALRDVGSTCRAWWGAAHPVADRRDLRPLLWVPLLTVSEKAKGFFRHVSAARNERRSGRVYP